MAKRIDLQKLHERENARHRARSKYRRDEYLRDLENTREIDISSTPTKIGDRTNNTPPLRMHARQSLRFDKEISHSPILVEPRGKYWFRDVPHTLAVIQRVKMMNASEKKIKHNVNDDGSKPFLIT